MVLAKERQQLPYPRAPHQAMAPEASGFPGRGEPPDHSLAALSGLFLFFFTPQRMVAVFRQTSYSGTFNF